MKITLNTKTIIILISGLVVVSLVAFTALFWSGETTPFSSEAEKDVEAEKGVVEDLGCVSSVEERIVRGNSLTGLIEPGETVKILFGYYDCNEIKKEDVIVYSYAGNSGPLIKIIKGIPGDSFNLEEAVGGWNILINGEVLKNSENQPYLLDQRAYNMLSLYERDYKGQIPADAYLIMSNLVDGGMDSTHFGLVSRDDILAKVEPI